MKQKSLILSLLLLLICSIGFSQSGKIAGKVIDGDFNDVLAFANIVIKDTSTGTTSDFDGNFQLEVEPGVYTVVFSYVGYETKELADVTVKPGQVTEVEVTLNTNSLDEVVVKTTVKRNTENAILNLQRKSSIVLDGLSAQSIKKTGASNVASAVKSVPGVSVQGGKYVFVRGLGDRYTKSILNGVDIPGLDPDRNTIPMDIFPTNIIDNVIVVKSAAAEYPADFTGGIVDIVTKDFPTKEEYSVSIGGSYNTEMHFNDKYLKYEGSDTDFFGYDDGTRNLPINRYQPIPGTFDNNILLTSLTDKFEKQLKADQATSGMNYNIGLTAGNQYNLNEKGDKKLGYLASFSYSNNTKFYEERIDGNYLKDELNPTVTELLIDKTTTGSEGINEVLVNVLGGLTYKSKLSKYKLTGMHIQNGESSAGLYNQRIAEAGGGSGIISAVKDALLYTERSITNLALSGSHQLGATTDWKFDWKIAPSFSKVQDKDHRVTPLRVINNGNGTQDFIIDASSVDNPVRLWRNLLEENWVFKADFSKKYELFNKPAQLKIGGGYIYKFRDFNTDRYIFTATDAEKSVANGDTNTLLLSQNIWNPTSGAGTYLDFNNIFIRANSYESEQTVSSFYISNEFNLADPLKLILGLRGEDFQLFYSGVIGDEDVNRQKTLDEFELFPSANAIYALNENSNVRGSFSRTTARPSFKEASTASIFDPVTNRIFIGGLDNGQTPPIKPSYINNFDLRYEWFREGGQMLAVSGFYKDFKDPIEIFFFKSAPDQLTVGNLGNAKVYGIEAEFRQNLGFVSKGLENLKLIANLSLIESELEMSNNEYIRRISASRVGETVDRKRELQGQSPYLVNIGLDYGNNDLGLQTGLFFNVQGKTLEVVGTGIVPDVYTQPFNSLNFTLNKTFGEEKRMAVDLKVKNILGDERESLYESYGASDQTFKFRDPGTEISLGISYKF